MIVFIFIVLGFLTSLVSVFLGPGGGIIMIPLLPLIAGLSVHEAVATSLITIFFVVSENAYRFSQNSLVRWPVVGFMGPLAIPSAIIAASIAPHVDEKLILTVFLTLLVLVAIRTFLGSFIKTDYAVSTQLTPTQKIFLPLGGILAGVTSGFTGVGSGVILAPLMIFLKVVRAEQLVPTANATMMCTTFAASLTYIFNGSWVHWYQWGLIRLDVALGVFTVSSFFSSFFRPHQNKLPLRMKSLLLSFLLFLLIMRIAYQLYSGNS